MANPALWAVTVAQFKRRLTEPVFLACFDQNSDAVADSGEAEEVLYDAQAKVEGALRGNYTLPLSPVPRTVTNLVLTFAKVEAMQRYPKLFMYEWTELEKSANADLAMLRKNIVRLDDGVDGASAEPTPVNAGVDVTFSNDDEIVDGVGGGTFSEGFGDY